MPIDKKIIIYCRVSTDPQDTLTIQLKENLQFAIKQNIITNLADNQINTILEEAKEIQPQNWKGQEIQQKLFNNIHVIREKHSVGTTDEFDTIRAISKVPSLNYIFKELIPTKQYSHWIFWKHSRLNRDTMVAHSLRRYAQKHKVMALSATEPNDSNSVLFADIINQIENKNRGDNIRSGHQQKFDAGLYVGKPPFGYRTELIDKNNSKSKRKLTVEQSEKKVLANIFDEFVKGVGAYQLSKKYGRSIQWLKSALSNKVYIGQIRRTGEWKSGVHEPIISEDAFLQVQQKIQRKKNQ